MSSTKYKKNIYDKATIAYEIQSLNIKNYNIEERQLLNPNKPKLTDTNNKNIIALIDTGINYTLSQFHKNIAVKNGTILGFDYWDNDDKPLTVTQDKIHFILDIMALQFLVF